MRTTKANCRTDDGVGWEVEGVDTTLPYVTKSQLAKKQQQKKVLSDATNCFSQRPTRTPALANGDSDSGNCSPQSNERIIVRIANRSP